MKRANQLVILVMAFVLASCAGTPDNSMEAKRKQLTDYKKQRLDLETKIAELEKELDANGEVKYVNVKALALEPRLFEHFVEVTGKVEADQEVNVSPEGSGKIIDILVREGQHVQKGTVLANLNTDMLDQSIAEAQIGLELAQTTFDRQKNLWDQKIGSELQFLQAKSNKESMERRLESLQAQKEMAVIKSPVDGVVDVIFQKKGEIASPQFPFAKVVNISRIKIYGDVAESYLTKVKKRKPGKREFSGHFEKRRSPNFPNRQLYRSQQPYVPHPARPEQPRRLDQTQHDRYPENTRLCFGSGLCGSLAADQERLPREIHLCG